jgi:peptidase E
MMTKFILHGGNTRFDNEHNHSFLNEIVKNIPPEGKVLIVMFATKTEKKEAYFSELIKKFKKVSNREDISYLLATESDFISQIKSSDAMYIQGGNTATLKETLLKYPDFKGAIKGKTIAGSSAGAYVLSTYYYTNSLNKVLKGLGLLPIRIMCPLKVEYILLRMTLIQLVT